MLRPTCNFTPFRTNAYVACRVREYLFRSVTVYIPGYRSLTRIMEVLGTNPGRVTGYRDRFFMVFLSVDRIGSYSGFFFNSSLINYPTIDSI
jgi:hypothetical protein